MLDEVRRIFAAHGPIAGAIAGHYEPRAEQVDMALAVARAMEARSHLLVEAGTGVGKSFAYLIPAMLRCLRGETVLIATNTIALQEQLIRKDVPLLRGILEADPVLASMLPAPETADPHPDPDAAAPAIRPVLVKGRGNYVSIRRLKLASQRQDKLLSDPAARRSLHVIEDWALSTLDGTLSTLPTLERAGVWDKVQSDSGNCMGRKCPTYDTCFYQTARAAMEGANLLICNHALFFSDLALRAQDFGFLPRYHHVVLDEAHGVEDVAGEHFGRTLAEGRVMHLLTTLCHPRSGKGYLPQLSMYVADTNAVERAIQLSIEAQNLTRVFFESVLRAVRRDDGPAFAPVGGRLRTPGVIDNVLTPAMRDLALRLDTLKELVKTDADRYELNAYAERARMIAEDAQILVEQSLPGCAYWVETSADDDGPGSFQKVTLACAPVEVSELLKERLFSGEHSVVLTSATLATRSRPSGAGARAKPVSREDGRTFEPVETESATSPVSHDEPAPARPRSGADSAFAHAMRRLGAEGADTLQLGSPFNYAAQMQLIVDLTPPESDAIEEPASDPFEQPALRASAGQRPAPLGLRSAARGRSRSPSEEPGHIARRVVHHVRETDGGAFVLFTSIATLRAVAALVREPLARLGHPVLAQTVDGSRTHILEQFRADERSVLLGAASFWQGVDVRGRGLRNVIITKLPFDPPDRPLTQARHELIQSRGGDPFREDTLPRAVIRFKQGFGRLIRGADDHGRVVVLDPRLVRSSYARHFLDSLPPGVPMTELS